MSSGLADCLVRDGVLPEDTVRSAAGRQMVYGGGLDTALLEMGAIDEALLWGTLATASGLPAPPPALIEAADPTVATLLGPRQVGSGLAVPVARHGDRVQVLCADPAFAESLRRAAETQGLDVELFIAPEVRVHVAAHMVFGTPMPPRFLRLLARLVGSPSVRRWVLSQAKVPPPLPRGPIAVTVTVATPPTSQLTTAIEPRAVDKSASAAPPGSKRAASRSAESGHRPGRARRAAAPPAAGPSVAGPAHDPAATIEGLAPLQQVMQQAKSMTAAITAPATIGEVDDTDGGAGRDQASVGERQDARAATIRGRSAIEPPPAPPPRRAGTQGAVRSLPAAPHAPQASNAAPDEQLLSTAETATAEARLVALRALRPHLSHPRVAALADVLRDDVANAPGERAIPSVSALGELRDPSAVPVLLGRLGEHDAPLSRAVHSALVEICKQDFGHSVRRWRTWWKSHQDDERIEWLFVGLSHKVPEIRYSASDELRLLTGEYFGYHFDLPKQEREEARARWESWWLENRGKPRPTAASGTPSTDPPAQS